MRTTQEIKDRVKKVFKHDFFGTLADLIVFLPFEDVKPYLKPEVTAEEWKQESLEDKTIIENMRKYMIFALTKAHDHRGLSAARSVEHFRNWLFLLGDNETLAFIENEANYTNYGVPMLKKICEKYDFEFPQDTKLQNMARGLKCYDSCRAGCG